MTHDPGNVWHPPVQEAQGSTLAQFMDWLGAERGVSVADYQQLHDWSVEQPDFWAAMWDHVGLVAERGDGPILADAAMPGASWFPGVRLNYVDQVLASVDGDRPAIIGRSEPGGPTPTELSWDQLSADVGALTATLRALGVGEGDRVVGYLPNIPEAVVAFLATASLGAMWSACGQDYAPAAAVDRLGQLTPTVLVAADGYRYAGKDHDRTQDVLEVAESIDSLTAVVMVPRLGGRLPEVPAGIRVLTWADAIANETAPEPVAVAFDHPLWVLFSSGTTGKPKGIMHGHGGVLLEHVKQMRYHCDLGPGDAFLWYTSPSWMMWNFQVAGLLTGTTIVCYDGSPSHPRHDAIWELASQLKVKMLGTSPAYLLSCADKGISPARDHDLSSLRVLGVTGSVAPESLNGWVAEHVGGSVAFASISGGTDVVTAFMGWAPTLPVWPGELSAPSLGADVQAWNAAGQPVIDEVGELVIAKPMPSMPVAFWNDPDRSRYRAAYFDQWPGVWRHGDWVTVTSHGSVVVHGRSDSTLNRGGVRMGSADIYSAVEQLPDVVESLVVGVEHADGTYWMPLFVHLADGVELTDELRAAIAGIIREEASVRHVPDEVIAVPGIPHTRTGKKLEIPVKRVLTGADPSAVADPSSIDDPTLLEQFLAFRP